MWKIIDDLIIKTQIFETMHEKFNDRKKNLSKNRDKIFLIQHHTKRKKSFENLRLLLTKNYFEKKKFYILFKSTFCDRKFESI